MTEIPKDTTPVVVSRGAPTPSRWNDKYTLIVVSVASILAVTVIFLYSYFWLPQLFANLIAQGLPGDGASAQRVYTLTTLIFAGPGILVIGPVLWWHFRPSRASRVTVLACASMWFLLGAPSGAGRFSTSGANLGTTIVARAGASPEVAAAWGEAVTAGSLISIVLGLAAGGFVVLRIIVNTKSSPRKTARSLTRKSNIKSD